MSTGSSRGRLGMAALAGLALTAVALLTALIAVILQAWTVAALAAICSMGFFMAYTTLALAAFSKGTGKRAQAGETSGKPGGKLSVEELRELRALRTSVESAEARTAASERRIIATVEAHREEILSQLHSAPEALTTDNHDG